MKNKKHRLFRKSLASVVLAALTLTFVTPAAQAASGPLAGVSLDQVTGTAPFDADDTPGKDSAANNDVVRTNDNVTYRTEITVGTKKAPGTHLYVYLPKGEQITQLPPYCLDGSTISPQLGDPAKVLTNTSWTALKAQTVDCYLGDLPAASSQIFSITSKVRPEVPDNTRLSAVTAKVTSGANSLTANSVSHRVSAKATYDVSLGFATRKNAGFIWGPSPGACPEDKDNGCYITKELTAMISVPKGGKGSTPLQSGFTFTVDLSAKGVFGEQITTTDAWKAAGAKAEATFRPAIPATRRNCLHDASAHYGPHSHMGFTASTTENSVRDSGTVVCTTDEKTGIMTVKVTGADTSAWTYPSVRGNGSASLPADRAYVFAKGMDINVPSSTVKALGLERDGTWTLPQTITASEVTGKALNGSTDTQGAPHTVDWNNYRTASLVIKDEGTLETFWTGVPGTRGNTPASQLRPGWQAWEGLPGQGSIHGGDGVLLQDQVGIAAVVHAIYSPEPGVGVMSCTSWDNASMSLAADNYKPGSYNQRIGSGGKAVWLSGMYWAGTPDEATVDIQYGSGPAGSATDSSCNDTDSKFGWNSDPALVKDFNTGKVTAAADAASGNYKAVNKVRALVVNPIAERNITSLAVALRYTGGKEAGDTLAYWVSVKSPGHYPNAAAAGADSSNKFSKPTFKPGATSDDPQSGSQGSRALVGVATSRINAQFADSGGNYSGGTPAFVAGAEPKLRLSPSVSAPVDTSKSYPASVEVCLPPRTSYIAGSSTVKPGEDVLVEAGMTKGTSVTCVPGERYMVFDLGRRIPNEPVPPIEMVVKIATSAPNGDVAARAAVQLDGDPSPASNRTDRAPLQIESPIGIRIGRTAASTVLEVNPAASLATPRKMIWNTEFVNLNSPTSVSDVEVYEVLPRNGYGNTKFAGTLSFESAVVERGDNIKVQYTNSTTLAIDEATGVASAATWFDTVAAAGGAAKVTGLKMTRPGGFKPSDDLNIKVTMVPMNNQPGNVYEGRVAGKAAGLKSAVGPEISAVEIVASTIGDTLWVDNNKDGLQNAGEVGLSGKTVTLTGTDLDGNIIPARTAVTNGSGKYSFTRLASGQYTVDFGVEALKVDDWTLAAPGLGNGEADSVPSKTTGKALVTLRPAQVRSDIDAGAQTATKLTASIAANPAPGTYVTEKDPLDYTLTMTNDGTKPFTSVTVDAVVDTGITVSTPVASQAGGTVKLSGNKITYTGALAKGETKTVTFKAVTGKLSKDTAVSTKLSGTGTWFGGKQASVCDTGKPAGCTIVHNWTTPRLAIVATVAQSAPADAMATLDEKLTYSFVVTNTGSVPVRAVQAKVEMPQDNLLAADDARTVRTYDAPGGAGAELAGKAKVDFGAVKHVYTVTQDDVDWGSILSTVSAAGITRNGTNADTNEVRTAVKTPATSQLQMTAVVQDDSGDGTAQVGEELVYRFKVVNSGTVSVEKLDIKEDFLARAGVAVAPEHTYDGRLSPGEAVVYVSQPYVVTPEDKVAKAVSTNSTAVGETRKNIPVQSNAHQLVASTPSPDGLDIVKRVADGDGDGFADLGEQLTYTFTVTNNSAVEAADGSAVGYEFHALAIADPMLAGVGIAPAEADFNGKLVPGQTVTYVSEKYAVTAANTTAGKVTNTASATAVNAMNKKVTSNTATASIPTTPTKVIIRTGAGAEPGISVAQGAAGGLLLLAAMALALTGYRRRSEGQGL